GGLSRRRRLGNPAGVCIHVPPPPPNLIVHVRMAKGQKVAFEFWRPLWVQGYLKIAKTTSPYGDASYHLTGVATQPFQESEEALGE
ncbi:MAG: DUF3299 domain-containing protein, partial [Thermodesulfobacteriota bacterium]